MAGISSGSSKESRREVINDDALIFGLLLDLLLRGVAMFRASVVDDTRDERGASISSDGPSSSMFSRDDAREERLFALMFPRTESFESDRSIEDLH